VKIPKPLQNPHAPRVGMAICWKETLKKTRDLDGRHRREIFLPLGSAQDAVRFHLRETEAEEVMSIKW
jgi:hypothetical protein